jgi:hypothetical protein
MSGSWSVARKVLPLMRFLILPALRDEAVGVVAANGTGDCRTKVDELPLCNHALKGCGESRNLNEV